MTGRSAQPPAVSSPLVLFCRVGSHLGRIHDDDGPQVFNILSQVRALGFNTANLSVGTLMTYRESFGVCILGRTPIAHLHFRCLAMVHVIDRTRHALRFTQGKQLGSQWFVNSASWPLQMVRRLNCNCHCNPSWAHRAGSLWVMVGGIDTGSK